MGYKIIGGNIAHPASDWTRKSSIYKGNPLISDGNYPGGSFGTDESNSEWTLLTESLLTQSPYNYNRTASKIHLADGIGSHYMDEVTVYKSTVSSILYKLTPGYKKESLWGVLPGTSVADFKNNILKADKDQQLYCLSHIDESIMTDTSNLASNDTLLVISADSVNSTKYAITLTPGGLSRNDTLASSNFSVTINDSLGTISGFSYGTLLKEIIAGVEIPSKCTFTVINGTNSYQPLKVLNRDTLYVDVQVTDNIFFEVTAENGIDKIVYQLKPDSSPKDAFVTSDFYTVDQSTSSICELSDETTMNGLFKYLTPCQGAEMQLIDEYGFQRIRGLIERDDRLFVISQDGTTVKVYYFPKSCTPGCLAYIESDVYTVDQINYLIIGSTTKDGITVSNFLANLIPAPGASVKVVNHHGIEKTGFIEFGDWVVVTSADGLTRHDYKIELFVLKINAIGKSSIIINPNPTSGNFSVSGIPAHSRIVIKNVHGLDIFETTAKNDNMQFSLENQRPGIYFILISNKIGSTCFKLIVE